MPQLGHDPESTPNFQIDHVAKTSQYLLDD